MQKYQNFTSDTLNGAINSSDLSLTVTDGAGWPSTGDFYIQIDSEILKVTARASNVLTVVRGQDNTAPAAHSTGVAVNWILSSGTMEGLRRDWTDFGSSANALTPSLAGRIVIPDDSPVFMYDDGSLLTAFGPVYRQVKPPALSNWTQVNITTGSVSNNAGGIALVANATAGQDMKCIERTKGSPPWTIEARILVQKQDRYNSGGIYVKYSGSNRTHGINLVLGGSTGPQIEIVKFTDLVTYNSSNNSCFTWDMYPPPTWLQITNDGTDLFFRYSTNGMNWKTLQQISRTHWLTGAADRVGVTCNATNATLTSMLQLTHWKEF